MFGYSFLKLLLRTIFENTENTISVLCENCYLNLVFLCAFQNKIKNWEPSMFFMFFFVLIVFYNKKQFSKIETKYT